MTEPRDHDSTDDQIEDVFHMLKIRVALPRVHTGPSDRSDEGLSICFKTGLLDTDRIVRFGGVHKKVPTGFGG